MQNFEGKHVISWIFGWPAIFSGACALISANCNLHFIYSLVENRFNPFKVG